MKYLLKSLSIGVISLTSIIQPIFNQTASINSHNIASTFKDVIIDTSTFNIEYDFKSGNGYDVIDVFNTFKVKIGIRTEINPNEWNYVSRKGDSFAYLQLAGQNNVVEFNPFAFVNFRTIKENQNPTADDIKKEANGKSPIQKLSIGNYWSTLEVYTAFFYAPDSTDFYINFSILAHIKKTVSNPNFPQIRAAYGQKVNFY